MAISRKQVWPQRRPAAATAIKYLTENGFSIVRVADLDNVVRNSPTGCRFIVQRDNGPRCEIQVSFDRRVVADLLVRRRAPLADGSMFWLVCAESCLATYLWEKDDLPPNGRLEIDQLTPDELMLALHWRDEN